MNVIIMPEADADMERIGEYIAQQNPLRALSILIGLRRQSARLADMPRRFPLVPRYEETGVRRCVHGQDLIFYYMGEFFYTWSLCFRYQYSSLGYVFMAY